MTQRQYPAQGGGAYGFDGACAEQRTKLAVVRPAGPLGQFLLCATALATTFLLAGCTHKTPWTPPPSLTAPVALSPAPEPQQELAIAPVTPPEFDPPEPTELPKKAPRRRTPAAPAQRDTPPPPPPQVASAAGPAALAIGSLTTGGEATPQTQQQARELIVAIRKRIVALPRSTASQQKPQVRQVTSFLKQAQQALDSGDSDGAITLATKARLIMDDIERK